MGTLGNGPCRPCGAVCRTTIVATKARVCALLHVFVPWPRQAGNEARRSFPYYRPQFLITLSVTIPRAHTLGMLRSRRIHFCVTVRFPVESKGRKSKGVSRANDPSRGRREETPYVWIAKRKGSTAGVDGTSLATGRREGAGDATESCRGVAGGRARPARERG